MSDAAIYALLEILNEQIRREIKEGCPCQAGYSGQRFSIAGATLRYEAVDLLGEKRIVETALGDDFDPKDLKNVLRIARDLHH